MEVADVGIAARELLRRAEHVAKRSRVVRPAPEEAMLDLTVGGHDLEVGEAEQHLRARGHERALHRELAGQPLIVGVEECHQVAARMGEAEVARRAGAAVPAGR